MTNQDSSEEGIPVPIGEVPGHYASQLPGSPFVFDQWAEEHKAIIDLSTTVSTLRGGHWWDYATNLNAMIQLLEEMGGSIRFDLEMRQWECKSPSKGDTPHLKTHPESPSAAVATCWIAWKMEQRSTTEP